MKRKMSLLLVLTMVLSICSIALADYTQSLATDKASREYKYNDDKLILQEGDIDEANLCTTIREIIKDQINTDTETIVEVSLDKDSVLHIVVDWAPEAVPKYMYNYELARSRFSSITDALLSFKELDMYWEKILYIYPNGEALFTKDMITESELFGRYIDGSFVDSLITE